MPLTLFCLPCAGASAAMYFRWRRALPGWIEVMPLELPGRGASTTEPPIDSFEPLCLALSETVRCHLARDPAAPYAIFGHSMGALLAYGVAQRLRALDVQLPAAMFLSACAAPSRRQAERYAGQDDAALMADLRRQGGTPAALFDEPDLLRMTLDLLAADYRVCQSFARMDAAPLPVPMQVFAGRADDIAEARLRAWQIESSVPLQLAWFEGGHFYLRQHEALLLARIQAGLERFAPALAALP